ncbi:MAG TPA: hypothetical protein VGL39_26440 [Jatrophihabitantaceae bacterium]
MNVARVGWVGVAACLVLVGCSGSGGKHFTIDDVAKAGRTCPDYLWTATTQAGNYQALEGTAAPVSADPSSTLAKAKGAGVDCTVSGPDLTLTLVAVREGSAVNLLLPKLGAARQLTASQLEAVARAAAATRPGHLVTLPGSGAASLGIVTIRGARSAAFVLVADSGTVNPDKVANRLAANLR